MSIGRRIAVTWLLFGVAAVIVCLLAPLVGSTSINLWRVFDSSIPFADNADAQIFFVARLPRVLAGALVGSSLAASGVVLQALLRNPLATPFTLGVSAGAALGAMLALTLDLSSGIAGFSAVPIASFAGSLGAVGDRVRPRARAASRPLDERAAARRRHTEFVLLRADSLRAVPVRFHADVSHGSLADGRSRRQQLHAARGGGTADRTVICRLRGAAAPDELLSISDESAASRGVDVHRTQRLAFLSASLATGAAVSLGGPVGFIGIVVPHLVRLMVGADHRLVLPASAFGGAAFLVACDTISRTALAPLEVPVGVVTAIIGGPFFLWLLIRNR